MTIFDYAEEFLYLMNMIEEADGEITSEVDEALRINEEDVERKLKAYVGLIKLNDGKVQVFADEIDRLSKRKKSMENLNTRLKEYCKYAVQIFGTTDAKTGTKKLKYDDLTAYIRKTTVVDWTDEQQNAYEQKVQDAVVNPDAKMANINDEYVRITFTGLPFSDAWTIAQQFPAAINAAKIHAKTNRVELLKEIKDIPKEKYPSDVPTDCGTKVSESVIFK